MTCDDCEIQLGPYMDQELDSATRTEVERHLSTCASCRTGYERQRALRSALREELPTFAAPDLFRARIAGAIRGVSDERARTAAPWWRWSAIAASALFVIAAGYATIAPHRATSPGDAIARDVVSSHVRSLMPDHLTDVASTDQHNVKPWFDGRLDYSPPVYDLAARGFPLVGGRLDYVDDQPVAVLVYQRRKHVINLFVWPTEGTGRDAPGLTRHGYHVLRWTRAGMTYWAVSDLNSDELREFARLHQALDSLATSREGQTLR